MSDRIKVLGVSINKVKMDQVLNLTNVYFNNDSLNMIYFAGTKTAIMAQEDEEFAAFVETADLVVPGDRNVEEVIFQEKSRRDKKIIASKYMERLLTHLNKKEMAAYLLGSSERKNELYSQKIAKEYPDITYSGNVLKDEMSSEELDIIINDINTIAPDVLILYVKGNTIKRFISECKSKMNVKLCICLSEAAEGISDEMVTAIGSPKFSSEKHLSKLFGWLFQTKNFHNFVLNRTFYERLNAPDVQREKTDGDDKA